jgi:hypothetical protein
LKRGGAHVFTVPYWPQRDTRARARVIAGELVHLEPPEYHADPVDPAGALVVTEWGRDLPTIVSAAGGGDTEVVTIDDRRLGIVGGFAQVFVTRVP